MSAGNFSREKYECDNGDVCPVRIQPETATATFDGTTNEPPAGAVNMNMFAKVNKGRREYGVGTRYITAEWDGAPPADYAATGTIKIAVLGKATYDGIALLSAGTYLGANITVIGKSPENIR